MNWGGMLIFGAAEVIFLQIITSDLPRMALIFRKNHIDPDSFSRRENNNFDLMRLVGACVVIFSHNYALALGDFTLEPLFIQTGGLISVGTIFLYMFFVLSGYLVTQSYMNSRNVLHYVQKRVIRIFPALIVVVLITMFVIGPLFSSLSPGEYFSERHTWFYLRNLSLYRLQTTLPGVFPNNPDPGFANTNFWTIALEFTWYMCTIFLVLAAIIRYRWPVILLFVVVYLLFNFGSQAFHQSDIFLLDLKTKSFLRVGLYYLAGTALYLYRRQLLQLNPLLLIVLLPGWFATVWFGYTDWTTPLCLPFLTIMAATIPMYGLKKITSIGDPSYGMYVWGVPLGQIVVAYTGMAWWPALVLTLVLSYLAGQISWRFVEKPALRLRNKVFFKSLEARLPARKLSL